MRSMISCVGVDVTTSVCTHLYNQACLNFCISSVARASLSSCGVRVSTVIIKLRNSASIRDKRFVL